MKRRSKRKMRGREEYGRAKRPVVHVKLTDEATGAVVHSETKAAFNSGIRASEAAVGAIARAEHVMYDGDKPSSTGDISGKTSYRRRWIGRNGRVIITTIEKEP